MQAEHRIACGSPSEQQQPCLCRRQLRQCLAAAIREDFWAWVSYPPMSNACVGAEQTRLTFIRTPTPLRFAHRFAGSGLTARPARAGWAFMCNARACDAPGVIRSDTVRWVTSQLHHLRDGAAHPRLQSDPRHEHHGKQAAPSQDQCRNSGTYAANCDNGTGTDPTPTPSREARSS